MMYSLSYDVLSVKTYHDGPIIYMTLKIYHIIYLCGLLSLARCFTSIFMGVLVKTNILHNPFIQNTTYINICNTESLVMIRYDCCYIMYLSQCLCCYIRFSLIYKIYYHNSLQFYTSQISVRHISRLLQSLIIKDFPYIIQV